MTELVIPQTNFPYYIEPRPEGVNQAYTAAHLAGSTKRKMLKKKLSSTKGNAQGKFKYVTYLPQEFIQNPNKAHPESDPHVTVSPTAKKASWREFTWRVI